MPPCNGKRNALVALLQLSSGATSNVADADEASGPAIIESAGLAVRKQATRKAARPSAPSSPLFYATGARLEPMGGHG